MVSPAETRQFLRRKADARRARNRAAWEAAAGDCAAIVEHIVDRYQPTRIWQWGSMLEPDTFDENSDIDLALEGVTGAEAYFSLLGDAMERTSFPLDIIQLEKIEPEFREIIQTKGRIIYERTGS